MSLCGTHVAVHASDNAAAPGKPGEVGVSEGQGKHLISNVRVLDEHAFRELTGKLTTLIADAESSSRQLSELVKQTEDVSGGASATRAQLDQRLEGCSADLHRL